jgi:hypothetical protein
LVRNNSIENEVNMEMKIIRISSTGAIDVLIALALPFSTGFGDASSGHRIGLDLLVDFLQRLFHVRPHGAQLIRASLCSCITGPSIRMSPVSWSMMTSSGYGTGSGPVVLLRARSAKM